MKNSRLSPAKKRPARWLTPQLRQQIEREARHLGLSQGECVQLFVTLSSVFRKTVMKNTTVDMKQFFTLVNSPIFGAIVEYLATAKNGVDNQAKSVDGKTSTVEDNTRAEPRSAPETSKNAPQRPQNESVPAQTWPPSGSAPHSVRQPPGLPMPPTPHMPEDDFYCF